MHAKISQSRPSSAQKCMSGAVSGFSVEVRKVLPVPIRMILYGQKDGQMHHMLFQVPVDNTVSVMYVYRLRYMSRNFWSCVKVGNLV